MFIVYGVVEIMRAIKIEFSIVFIGMKVTFISFVCFNRFIVQS